MTSTSSSPPSSVSSSLVLSSPPSSYSFVSLLNYVCNLLYRSSSDFSLISRVFRLFPHLKNRLSRAGLEEFASQNERFQSFLNDLRSFKTVEMNKKEEQESLLSVKLLSGIGEADNQIPEIHSFLDLLLVVYGYQHGEFCWTAAFSRVSLDRLSASSNRRSLDWIHSKLVFYCSITHEKLEQIENEEPFASLRPYLLSLYRSACLNHNEPGQAALINAILRNYLHSHLYGQADTFRLKSNFPQNSRSQSQVARYFFYCGVIEAVQLHYSDSLNFLQEAIRKAPAPSTNSNEINSLTAIGFRQQCHKLLVCVQLLMGEIPARETFHQSDVRKSLAPYELLALAVKSGDLHSFQECMKAHRDQFIHDSTYSLIIRLRHNVIKAGLRAINVSYTRITLKEIALKLSMAEVNQQNELAQAIEDLQFILAKAIHDGVIEGKLVQINQHGELALVSNREVDVYSTVDPQVALNKRIDFAMGIFNDSVKALTFPPSAQKSIAGVLYTEESDDEDDETRESQAHKKAAEREEKERKEEEQKKKK
jgi:26S proteasome regulatory subunit N3